MDKCEHREQFRGILPTYGTELLASTLDRVGFMLA